MWDIMKQFPVPADLRDGILYCQRSLRDFVLQHQNLASKINKLPKHQRQKAKSFMLDLEAEMIEIGQEQRTMVHTLTKRLGVFRAYVLRKTDIEISEEIVNGYIARLLYNHNETVATINPPSCCKKRLTANELSKNYSLENFTKLEKFIDDDNANFAPWNTDPEHKIKRNESKASKVNSNFSGSSSSSPSPVRASSASRSLLKPKQERLNQHHSTRLDDETGKRESKTYETRAFASVIKSGDGRDRRHRSSSADVKHESHDEEDTAAAGAKKPEGKTVRSKAKSKQPQLVARRGGIWMPGFRGRPPKGTRYVPTNKLAVYQAQNRESYVKKIRQLLPQSGGGGRQRGRPPKGAIKLEKSPTPPPAVEPPETEHDSSEEQPFGRPSAAVRRGRSNLQMALNRLKRPLAGGESAETIINTTATELAKKSKPSGGSKLVKHGSSGSSSSSGSSGSSPSSRSSTPTLGLGGMGLAAVVASDDSSDRRCDALLLDSPPGAEPDEPPPNDIWELGKKALLNYFGLCTPEEAKARRERRQERKRRSCYSTERKDFHYGRLDYYEQQQLQAATRTSKRTHQRPILYSPPVAVTKKRKHQQQQQAQQQHQSNIGTVRVTAKMGLSGITRQQLPTRCASVDSRDIFAAMSNRNCFVCNKTAPSFELNACTNCCNIYHISCHQDEAEDNSHLYRHRDDLCPVCLTAEDDGDK